jgi:ribosomal protein L31E
MAEEKIITLNLRKQVVKIPEWERSSKAVKILRDALQKKTKIKKIKIEKSVNEKIWSRSIKNPVTSLRIKVTKIDDESGKAELIEK